VGIPACAGVSPGLTAGGGLKPTLLTLQALSDLRFPRPHRRGRIETSRSKTGSSGQDVSPGLTAGGGLKLHLVVDRIGSRQVSPGLTAGGGLKRLEPGSVLSRHRFPRPHRRGRIETTFTPEIGPGRFRFPRPHRRGRIETLAVALNVPTPAGFPRPHRRGRIETPT